MAKQKNSPEPVPLNKPVTREDLVRVFGEEAVKEADRYVVVPGPYWDGLIGKVRRLRSTMRYWFRKLSESSRRR